MVHGDLGTTSGGEHLWELVKVHAVVLELVLARRLNCLEVNKVQLSYFFKRVLDVVLKEVLVRFAVGTFAAKCVYCV